MPNPNDHVNGHVNDRVRAHTLAVDTLEASGNWRKGVLLIVEYGTAIELLPVEDWLEAVDHPDETAIGITRDILMAAHTFGQAVAKAMERVKQTLEVK